MLDEMFKSIIASQITASAFFICLVSSLVIGAAIAVGSMFKSRCTPSFIVTLALLPSIVCVVIMLVNGNIGAGVAVAGAFSLVRFRSAPGSAREISGIFLAMAVGLACGMGYIAIAVVFAVVIIAVNILYTALRFGESRKAEKDLKITIPESLDYSGMLDDLFREYASTWELVKVKTANLGSLYQLHYVICLKNQSSEKELIDKIRCRNGNLDICISRVSDSGEAL